MRRIALAGLLVVVTLLAAIGAVGVGAAIQSDNVDAEGLSIEELRSGGQQLPNAPPSVRSDGERMWWALHWEPSAFGDNAGNPSGSGASHVQSGATVERNSVYVRTIVAAAAEDTDRTIVVAYWEPTTREVATGNGTVEREVADVHAVDRVNATISQGWPMIEVPLRQSDGRQVSMWLEDDPDVRWTFTHDSVATTASSGISTQGGLLRYIAIVFAIPLVVGAAITGTLSKIAIKRAARPPGWPLWAWFVVIGIAVGGLVMNQFSTLAELLVAAPTVIAVLVALIFGVFALESQTYRSRKVEFLRPKTIDVTGPDDAEISDALEVDRSVEHVVDMPDGRLAVVRTGLIAFLARVFGGAAVLPSRALGDTAMDVQKGDIDQLVVVDPRSDHCLDYEAESWGLKLPDVDDWEDAVHIAIPGVVLFLVVSTIGSWLAWSWAAAIGAVAILAMLAEPQDGRADVDVASAHQRAAWISMLVLESDLEDVESLQKARNRVVKEQVRGQQEVDAALADQDRTLVEEMFTDDEEDVERALDDLDDLEDTADRLDEDQPELSEVESDDD